MKIEGLIPLKSSTDQAMASLYFMRIFNSFNSFYSVKSAAIITSYALSALKKAYFKGFDSFFKDNPSELVYISFAFSSLLLDFSVLFSIKRKTISFKSKLEVRYSKSRSSRY